MEPEKKEQLIVSEEQSVQIPEKKTETLAQAETGKKRVPAENHGRKRIDKVTVVCVAVALILAAVTGVLFRGILHAGTESLVDQYKDAYENERDDVYNTWYQKFFDKAEEKYHVANRVSISIGNIREVGNLEVLKVSDEEYILQGPDDNDANVTVWLKASGEGTFVVDLISAEFLIDEDRACILVRVPVPELSNVGIDKVQKLLFKNESFFQNGNYLEGEELAQDVINEATSLVQKEFLSNESYFKSAQESARSSIECLIRQINPDVENLTVEVEFIENQE